MKDRVPLYPGRVRLTPVSGQENTYDMVRADEPTQEGTPLSKKTLLQDETATLFGLDENAVPDDVFEKTAEGFHGYWWHKFSRVYNYTETTMLSGDIAISELASTGGTTVIYYSDEFEVIGTKFSLVNPSRITLSYDTYEDAEVLKGKYFLKNGVLWFIDLSANIYQGMQGTYYAVKFDKGAYYENPSETKNFIGNVCNMDINAYPNGGFGEDGYYYDSRHSLLDKLIATGSYTGTGTYGISNPNSLTFDFEPKVVLLSLESKPGADMKAYMGFGTYLTYQTYAMISDFLTTDYVKGLGFMLLTTSGDYCYGKKSSDGKTFYWYYDGTKSNAAAAQANRIDGVYHYIAIG